MAAENAVPGVQLFADRPLERQQGNGYVSATACRDCHAEAYLQWSATRHAFAYQTLLNKERYFDAGMCFLSYDGVRLFDGLPDRCPGFNDSEGCNVRRVTVPASGMSGTRKRDNIRSGSDTSLCLECHDPKHSPGFAEVVSLHTKDVDHSRSPMNLEELLASRVSRVGKPRVELFVMSYCPYAVKAEEKLIPIVKAFGDKIDFRLQFIAEEKETSDCAGYNPLYESPRLPGGGGRYTATADSGSEYPDRYLDYILCRGKKLEKSWEECAQKLGIDVSRIQALFDSPEAEQLFRENIKRAAALGINASPTIFVDGHQFRADQLLRASGTPCQ